MSFLYEQGLKDYERDWPIDLGTSARGAVRAFWATNGTSEEKAVLVVAHRNNAGEVCAGSVFIKPFVSGGVQRPVWDVVMMEPLTLSPSIKCDCGFHGFIENGKWRDT